MRRRIYPTRLSTDWRCDIPGWLTLSMVLDGSAIIEQTPRFRPSAWHICTIGRQLLPWQTKIQQCLRRANCVHSSGSWGPIVSTSGRYCTLICGLSHRYACPANHTMQFNAPEETRTLLLPPTLLIIIIMGYHTRQRYPKLHFTTALRSSVKSYHPQRRFFVEYALPERLLHQGKSSSTWHSSHHELNDSSISISVSVSIFFDHTFSIICMCGAAATPQLIHARSSTTIADRNAKKTFNLGCRHSLHIGTGEYDLSPLIDGYLHA